MDRKAALNETMQAAVAAGFGIPSQWDALQGGRVNRVFLAQVPSGRLVFKFFDTQRANVLFPNDIDGEARALAVLSDTQLAPRLRGRFDTKAGPCLVYDYVEGAVAKRTTVPAIIALSKLHAQAPTRGLRALDGSPSALIEQGLRFLASDTSDRAAFLMANVPAVSRVPDAKVCFLHSDPTPANTVMRPDGGVTFVDWQCPAIGDPVHDLAIALSPAMHAIYGASPLAAKDHDILLEAYGDADVVARYRVLVPLYHWRMACYCQWKTRSGEAEYAAAGVAEFS